MKKNKIDDSIEVFYNELLNKILEDPCDNSYTEFNYEFKNRNRLFNAIQSYLNTPEHPFYETFMSNNALYNIKIKELRFIECYEKSVPVKGGKYVSRYVIKFTILYEKK